jgi:hypothetical protein
VHDEIDVFAGVISNQLVAEGALLEDCALPIRRCGQGRDRSISVRVGLYSIRRNFPVDYSERRILVARCDGQDLVQTPKSFKKTQADGKNIRTVVFDETFGYH